jgi:hypothetical protein
MIDLIQGGCPENLATQWLLKSLTRSGEMVPGEGHLTYTHDDMVVTVDAFASEMGTYLKLDDVVSLFQKLRTSLNNRADIEKEDAKDMREQVKETFDVIDGIMADLKVLLEDYWGED